MEIGQKCLALVFSSMMLLQAYVMRRYVGNWLSPASLFSLFWFAFSFFPLVGVFSIPIYPYGTGLILVYAFAFSCSAFLFGWKAAFERNRETEQVGQEFYSSPVLRKAFYLVSFVAVLSAVVNSITQGASLRDLLFDTIITAASYRDLVLSGDIKVSIYFRVSEILAHLSAILGGLIISTYQTRKGRLGVILLSFVTGAYMATAQSSKWTLFTCIALFYAGLLAYRISTGDFRLLQKGSFKKILVCFLILFSIATISFMSRGLQYTNDATYILDTLKFYFASYSFGHLYGFSDWLAFKVGAHAVVHYSQKGEGYLPGSYTFPTIFRTLGADGPGPYDDYFIYTDQMQTNIYTMFRGLIQDFGVLGSVVFMFLAGIPCHAAFRFMLTNKKSCTSVSGFIFAVVFIYASYGVSIFSWSWIYFAFPLLWVILALNKYFPWLRSLFAATGATGQISVAGATQFGADL